MQTFIYHIALIKDWRRALERGCYELPSLASEGFLHCSTASQLVDTANLHFRGHRRVLLLKICVDKLSAPLRFEQSRDQQEFPHLYGPLNCSAVDSVKAWAVGTEALFTEPTADNLSALSDEQDLAP